MLGLLMIFLMRVMSCQLWPATSGKFRSRQVLFSLSVIWDEFQVVRLLCSAVWLVCNFYFKCRPAIPALIYIVSELKILSAKFDPNFLNCRFLRVEYQTAHCVVSTILCMNMSQTLITSAFWQRLRSAWSGKLIVNMFLLYDKIWQLWSCLSFPTLARNMAQSWDLQWHLRHRIYLRWKVSSVVDSFARLTYHLQCGIQLIVVNK